MALQAAAPIQADSVAVNDLIGNLGESRCETLLAAATYPSITSTILPT